jgi:hypothetical protein
MAKSDKKIHEYRMSGAAWILDFAQKYGIDEAVKELKQRNAEFIPLEVSHEELEACTRRIKNNVVDSICLLSAVTLRDEFDFGRARLNRFIDRFNTKAECLADDDVSWSDMRQTMREECGLDFNWRRGEGE